MSLSLPLGTPWVLGFNDLILGRGSTFPSSKKRFGLRVATLVLFVIQAKKNEKNDIKILRKPGL
jgi:hypothetical protein